MSSKNVQDLLKWLDEDTSDIYIPPVAAASPARAAPQQQKQLHSDNVGRIAVHRSSDAQKRDDEVVCFRRILTLYAEEETYRQKLMWEYFDSSSELLTESYRHALDVATQAAKKASVVAHNRELISADLIKELVEADRAHREEAQQMLMLFQQVVGSGSATGSKGQQSGGRRR